MKHSVWIRLLALVLCLSMVVPGLVQPAEAATGRERYRRTVQPDIGGEQPETSRDTVADVPSRTAEETVKITQQPVSVTVAEGETAKVSLKATGDGLTYRWYYKDAGDSDYTYTSSFTGNTYSVKMNEARNGRRVLCKVSDKYGNTVKSNSVTIHMKATQNAVKITQQPVSVTVAEGEKATVKVVATGDGLTYRWYYKNAGDSSYTYTSSFTGNTYSVVMNEARSGRRVLCKVSDKYGNTVQSESVTLNMAAAKNTVRITQQPVSVTVAEGEKATVKVVATGDGLTYRWYYKNAGDSDYTYTSSFTGNTYSVVMNEARSGRRVLCKVSDKYGNAVQSESVTLNMAAAKNTVAITQQPVSVTVAEGEKATVKVVATGDGLTYRWYYKNAGATDYTYTSSFTGNTYSVVMNEARDGRRVLCKISDKYGNTVQSKSVTVNMEASTLAIAKQPKNVNTDIGEDVTFTVAASGGKAPYRYQWQYIMAGMSEYEDIPESWIGYIGVNSASVTFPASKEDLEGNYKYRCVITDASGKSVVSDPAWLIFPLKIDKHPTAQYAVGESSFFTVKVVGGVEPYSYNWEYISESQPTWQSISMSDRWLLNEHSNTLEVQNTGAATRHYEFRCTVTDANGNTVSSNAAKYIAYPTFYTQPVDAWATQGAMATFTVKVGGAITPYTYQWQRSANSGGTWTDIAAGNTGFSGQNTATLTVNSVTAADLDGQYLYRCMVRDADSTVATSNAVRIRKGMQITSQPQHVYGNVGDDITLRVSVSGGAGSYSYQWQYIMDGMDEFEDMPDSWIGYEGVNSSAMSFPAAREDFEDGILYRCVITDAANNTIASAAAGMYKPMSIVTQPVMTQVNVGDIATLTVAVSGGCTPYKYQWQYLDDNCNGVYQKVQDDGINYEGTYAGCSTASLKVKLKTAHMNISRCYRCVITDANGKSVTSYLVPVTKK